MKKHAQTLIENISKSETLKEDEKSDMMTRLKEWQEDNHAADDVVAYFDTLWLKIEPFFKELGLV